MVIVSGHIQATKRFMIVDPKKKLEKAQKEGGGGMCGFPRYADLPNLCKVISRATTQINQHETANDSLSRGHIGGGGGGGGTGAPGVGTRDPHHD